MFENLQNLGWGLVGFALIIGIGSVVLHRFGGAVADCTTQFEWNSTLDRCCNISSVGGSGTVDCSTGVPNGSTPIGTGWVNTNYLSTELGSTGLAGWTPAIVAIAVGMMIFGAFMIRRGAGRTY